MTPYSFKAALELLDIDLERATSNRRIELLLRNHTHRVIGDLLEGPFERGYQIDHIVVEQYAGGDYHLRTIVIDIEAIDAVSVPWVKVEKADYE